MFINKCKLCGRFAKSRRVEGGAMVILVKSEYVLACPSCLKNPKHSQNIAFLSNDFNTRRSGVLYVDSK